MEILIFVPPKKSTMTTFSNKQYRDPMDNSHEKFESEISNSEVILDIPL